MHAAASITRPDLTSIRDDLQALGERLVRARATNARVISYRGNRAISVSLLVTSFGLDTSDSAATLLNRFARRAALLHSDVAVFAPPELAVNASGDASMLINDGQLVGYSFSGLHWEFARRLLDLVGPQAAADPAVRAWYLAAGRLMRRQLSHGYSGPHLIRAAEIFPGEAEVAFLSGCLHESLAGPRVQSYLRYVSTGPRDLTSDGEFRRAEASFREALQKGPDEAETRLRLGHVLLERGKAGEAQVELTRALELVDDPVLDYFASLFLGDAEQALGRRDRAQAAYERAAAAYPDAQSPRLALGQLARRFGDRQAALDAMEPLFSTPVWRPRADPWWDYDPSTIETQDELVSAVRLALQEEAR